MELMGNKVSSKDLVFKGLCFNCNQEGHKQVECPNKSSGGAMSNHVSKFANSARLVSHCSHIVPHLLGRGVPGAPTLEDIADVDSAHSLFQLQRIPFENRFIHRVSTFFDSGSNVNLVTESFARRAKLKGQVEGPTRAPVPLHDWGQGLRVDH